MDIRGERTLGVALAAALRRVGSAFDRSSPRGESDFVNT